MSARLLIGDVFEQMARMEDGSVDVIVTSPPFLALRSYLPADHPEKSKEIGTEGSPADFLDTMLRLTTEWRRVLAPHGSLCVEFGDTYSGSGGAGGDYNALGIRAEQPAFRQSRGGREPSDWPLAKSLTGIPSLYAFSLAYGRNLLNPVHEIERWRVRNLIAWTRPNPPVGALGDKCRPGTSYVTTACVGSSRYFDMDAERSPTILEPRVVRVGAASASRGINGGDSGNPDKKRLSHNAAGAPLLDHWSIPTHGYSGSHYAVFPEELPRRLISLMCPKKVCRTCGKPSERTNDGWSDCGHDDYRPGIVLDPFAGSGTTLAVAVGMGLEAIGIDIDDRNVELVRGRVGMFLETETAESMW